MRALQHPARPAGSSSLALVRRAVEFCPWPIFPRDRPGEGALRRVSSGTLAGAAGARKLAAALVAAAPDSRWHVRLLPGVSPLFCRDKPRFRATVAAFILALLPLAAQAESFGEHFQSVPPWKPFNEGQNLGDMGYDHGKYHDTYRMWTNKAGIGCCNDNDCRPTEARIRDDGIWEAVIDGQWTAIPPDKEINEPAPDGRPHVCASEYRVIYCFVKPPAS